jgi:hypothetical protein
LQAQLNQITTDLIANFGHNLSVTLEGNSAGNVISVLLTVFLTASLNFNTESALEMSKKLHRSRA